MDTTNFNEPLLKILLVDNTPKDALMIKEFLEPFEYSVTFASNLSETLQLLTQQSFNVLLIDIMLPDSKGLSTLRKLMLTDITIPIIVIADHDDEEIALASVGEGAQDYLVKNKLNPENLLRAIKLAIERKNVLKVLKKRTRQFLILSRAIADMNDCESILSVYQTFCSYMQRLLKDSMILPVDLADPGISQVLSDEMIETYVGLEIQSDEIFRELISLFPDGKLHSVPKDILEKLNILPADEIYVIGFLKNEKHYGGAIIVYQKGIDQTNAELIETLSSQVSINIHKKWVENTLTVSEKQYRILFAEIKHAKEELESLNDDLEMKIQIRTHELIETNSLLKSELDERKRIEEKLKKYAADLKEINAMKDKFFGIIAHDLKNPFTSLLGASDLLVNYVDKFDIDNIKNISMLLSDSAKRGYALLENLLEWSRAQTGSIKFNPQKYDVNELITESLNNLEFFRANKKIKLFLEIPEGIKATVDKNMFNSIMRNLLSNAVKFTKRGGQITVKCESCNDYILFCVKDSGVGIPNDEMHKLFRIDLKYTSIGTAKERGTGLGLLLCKEFVQKHCGKIWVESEEGQGSEFKFTIPNNIKASEKQDKRIESTKVTQEKNQK